MLLELGGDWRGAIEAWRSLDAPYEAALAALPGDDRAAREALTVLHRLGATGAARAFARERAVIGARAPRGPRRSTLANRAGLTRREQEVLERLASGATNREIAATLCLSERTIAHHVSAILAKLGVPNRHGAIAQARERGLLAQEEAARAAPCRACVRSRRGARAARVPVDRLLTRSRRLGYVHVRRSPRSSSSASTRRAAPSTAAPLI